MTEPKAIDAGTTVTWSRSWDAYPSDSGWSLNYTLTDGRRAYAVLASADGNGGFSVTIPRATTAGYAPGVYMLSGYAFDPTERHLVYRANVTVRPDASTGEAVDLRSQNERILDAVTAAIENRATNDQLAISLGGRSLQRHTLIELVALQNRYAWIVSRERGETGVMTNIGARFGRPS